MDVLILSHLVQLAQPVEGNFVFPGDLIQIVPFFYGVLFRVRRFRSFSRELCYLRPGVPLFPGFSAFFLSFPCVSSGLIMES